MAGKSTIRKLPREVQDLIGGLRREGRTIDQIMDKLRELRSAGAIDQDVSRSALGRHCKEIEELRAELEQSRVVADALVGQLGDEPASRTAALNVQLAHTVLFKLYRSATRGEVTMDAEEAMFAASALQKITSAAKTDAEMQLRIRKELAAKLEKPLADAEKAAAAGRPEDMAAALARIRADVYGIHDRVP